MEPKQKPRDLRDAIYTPHAVAANLDAKLTGVAPSKLLPQSDDRTIVRTAPPAKP